MKVSREEKKKRKMHERPERKVRKKLSGRE